MFFVKGIYNFRKKKKKKVWLFTLMIYLNFNWNAVQSQQQWILILHRRIVWSKCDLTWVHCTSKFGLIGAVDWGRTVHLAQVFLTSMFTRTIAKVIVDVLHYDFSPNGTVCYGEQSGCILPPVCCRMFSFHRRKIVKGKWNSCKKCTVDSFNRFLIYLETLFFLAQ